MKSLSAVLIIGIFVPVVCFGQTQTGNASYNPAKSGYHIAHASLSFGARVRVTNLKNNEQVIATVNGRISVSDPRVAEVYKDAGDAIGMAASGYTEVRLEQVLPEPRAASAPAEPPVSAQAPAEPPVSAQPPAPVRAAAQQPPPSAPVPTVPPAEPLPVAAPPPVQYVFTERSVPLVQPCGGSPLCVAILVLAIVAVVLLVVILLLILIQPFPHWLWFRPLWIRRQARYRRKHRRS